MKDRIGFGRWVNMPIRNITQNRYTRFVTAPGSELKSLFTDSQSDWKTMMEKKLKTHYHEVWDE